MQNRLRTNKHSTSFTLPLAAFIIAATIFVADSVTHPEIAVAPLYAAVVLLVVRFLDTRGVLLVSAGCMLLAIGSALLHDRAELTTVALINLFASLSAIVITTHLVLQNQSASLLLQEQANLLDVTHDAIIVRDLDDVITYWNRGAEQLYGWGRDQANGKVSHRLLGTVSTVPLKKLNAEVVRTGRWEGTLLHTRRDGVQLTIASRWSLQRDPHGAPIAVLESNNDITAQTRAREALQRTQSELAHVTRVATLGELVASITHEVNQPLAAIVANGEASLRWLDHQRPRMDEARDAIKRVIGEGIRASEVVKRLRDLSRKIDTEKLPLDLNQVVNDVIPLVQHEAFDHNISLEFECDSGLPTVIGDRVQLQQVVLNLLLNAIEAMSGVTDHPCRVLIRTYLNENDQVVVAVQDSGTGIRPEDADRLFSPFFTTKPGGMGMGLSICRSIIQGHGGRVWASKNEGPGMTLQFALPTAGKEEE